MEDVLTDGQRRRKMSDKKKKNENQKNKTMKWAAGSIALGAAAFYILPSIQKKLSDKLYQKMRSRT